MTLYLSNEALFILSSFYIKDFLSHLGFKIWSLSENHETLGYILPLFLLFVCFLFLSLQCICLTISMFLSLSVCIFVAILWTACPCFFSRLDSDWDLSHARSWIWIPDIFVFRDMIRISISKTDTGLWIKFLLKKITVIKVWRSIRSIAFIRIRINLELKNQDLCLYILQYQVMYM